MTRHGIVIPIPDLTPPLDCRGGPAFCAVCNAEMIEIEELALGLSAGHERRMAHQCGESRFVSADDLNAIWLRRTYQRAQFRTDAIRMIKLRANDEGDWRKPRGRKGGRHLHADNMVAAVLGLTLKQYRRRQHREKAAAEGISAREWYRRRHDKRCKPA